MPGLVSMNVKEELPRCNLLRKAMYLVRVQCVRNVSLLFICINISPAINTVSLPLSVFFSQEVHEFLKEYELKYCFVDRNKGTGKALGPSPAHAHTHQRT